MNILGNTQSDFFFKKINLIAPEAEFKRYQLTRKTMKYEESYRVSSYIYYKNKNTLH